MAKLSDKLAPDIRLTYEIVFEQNDFLVLKSRIPNTEIITVREWQNEAFKNNEPNETEPDWDKELFADRYELLEVFGLQKQQLVTTFIKDDRKTALIRSTWSAHDQYELETSVFDKDKIISIVWSTQTENGARSSLEKLQTFAGQYSGERSPAAAKSSKTEADYCLLCDVNLYEGPVRETLASIEKTIRPTCKRDPPGGVNTAQAGKWILGCVKGLAGSVLSIIKMFYEIANFSVKMAFNSRYQQKVANSVGSATSAFIWHPIDTLTSMYKVVEGLFLKESVTLATCGREYRAKATCQLFGELISGGLIVKSIKRILGISDKASGLHRIAGAKYNHPIRKKVTTITARRLAGATPTRALIATAIIDQENPHLKVKPKLTPPKERSELARTSRTRSTDRAPQKSPILAAARDRIIEKSLQYNPTTVTQNSRFINKALISRISDNRIFLDVENSLMKKINDLTKDKNLVTALTNLHKKILISEIDELLKPGGIYNFPSIG
ncbi:MAG: hypothetical protein AABZ31_15035, partial [Bdellovibrionota bacterium]